MKLRKLLTTALMILCSVVFGVLTGQNYEKVNAQSDSKFLHNLLKVMEQNEISVVRRYGDDGEFYAVLRKVNVPPDKDSDFRTSEKLSIYDKKGKELFSKSDFGIVDFNFYFSTTSYQLFIETNGGGTDNFLEIYDVKNGKFEEIIDSFETQMRGGYCRIPEYRTGVTTPYFKPPQIMLISQGGGADEDPPATIFRYRNNRYKSVGEIRMQEFGDFIEKKLSTKN